VNFYAIRDEVKTKAPDLALGAALDSAAQRILNGEQMDLVIETTRTRYADRIDMARREAEAIWQRRARCPHPPQRRTILSHEESLCELCGETFFHMDLD